MQIGSHLPPEDPLELNARRLEMAKDLQVDDECIYICIAFYVMHIMHVSEHLLDDDTYVPMKAIIQKIADERRRRAEEARLSRLPAERLTASSRRSNSSGAGAQPPPQSSSSIDFSASIIQSDSIAFESSATSEPTQQNHERKEQDRVSSSARGGQSYVRSEYGGVKASADVPAGAAVAGYSRRIAWEQEQELAASEAARSSAYGASADEFPFPDTQGQRRADDRGGGGVNAGNFAATRGGGVHNKDSLPMQSPAGPTAVTLTSSRSTDRSDVTIAGDPVSGNSRVSRDGSNSNSNHDRMNYIVSRRRGSGGSTGSGPVGGSCSPGRSSHAKRASGVAGWRPTEGGGSERYGAHDHPAVSGRAGTTTKGQGSASLPSSRHFHSNTHEQNMEISDRAPLGESPVCGRESWTHSRAGNKGREGGQGSHGEINGAFAKQPQDGSAAAGQSQQDEVSAAGQGGWDKDDGDGEGARLESVGKQQANERIVDEDAYRFRSFSEEVWCTLQ